VTVSVAGRYVVPTFFGSAASDAGRAVNAHIARRRALFDDERVCWFGVRIDPLDESEGRVRQAQPGCATSGMSAAP
jgi:hypothetical protein